MSTDRYDIYGAMVDTTYIPGVTNVSQPQNPQTRGERGGGVAYPETQSLVAQRPAVNFTALAIATILAKLGVSEYAITGAGLILFAQKHAEGGTRAGASSHRKFTYGQGIIVPRRLSIAQTGDAVLTVEALVTSADGVTHPMTITDSQSLSAATASDEVFGLGPVDVAGVTYTGVQNLDIDFGNQPEVLAADGNVWATQSSNVQNAPVVTLRGTDPLWVKATGGIPLGGVQCAHADTILYLRKRALGGTYVANVTAEHVKFTMAGLAHVIEPHTGDGNTPAETEIRIEGHHDGSNLPLLVATNTAIS